MKSSSFEGFCIKVVLCLSLVYVQIISKLVVDDPNLDNFSRDLFNSANFDISKDNYSIQDTVTVFDISTLSPEILSNKLEFSSLSLVELVQGVTLFKYGFFKTVSFVKGTTADMVFDGFQCVGDDQKRVSVLGKNVDYAPLLKFSEIKSVSIKETIFVYTQWAAATFAIFDSVANIYMESFTEKFASQNFLKALVNVTNTQNLNIDLIDVRNSTSPIVFDYKQVKNYRLNKLVFQWNTYRLNGHFFLSFYQVQQILLYNLYINNNSIKVQDDFTILSMTGSDVVRISRANIASNSVTNGYITFFISQTTKMYLSDVFTTNNVHEGDWGGTMYLDSAGRADSEIQMTDCKFKNNVVNTPGGAMYASALTISIFHSKFQDNVSQFSGGAIFVENAETFTIEEVLFEGNSAIENGGAISFQSGSQSANFEIKNSTFTNNYAHFGSGGALYSIFFNTISMNTALFQNNKAFLGDGGAIFARNVFVLSSTDVLYKGNIANKGGAVRAESASFLVFIQSNFTQNIANYTGGACYLLQIINNCQFETTAFQENTAMYGGAIFIFSQAYLDLKNSLFTQNFVQNDGGALFFSGETQSVDLTGVVLKDNKALGIGGAIYAKTIKYLVTKETKITQNEAQIGGGIAYNVIKPVGDLVMIKIDTVTTQNTASIYGDNLANIPSEFILAGVSQFDEASQELIPLNVTTPDRETQSMVLYYDIDQVKTPSILIFYWKLLGKQLNAITPTSPTANDITELINIQTVPNLDTVYNPYNFIQKQSFLLNYTIVSNNYFTTAFYVIGQPENNFKTQFSFLSGIQGSEILVNVDFKFRNCEIGEVYIADQFQLCYQCRPGTYSFSDPFNSTCEQKPDEVQDSYGSTWIMKSGYWRLSEYSSEIFGCPYSNSCIGGQGYGNDLCSEGYQGMLCKECTFTSDIKYTQNLFDQQCTNCKDKKDLNVFQIVVLFLYLIMMSYVVMSYLIYDQLNSKMAETLIKMKAFIMDKRQTERRKLVVYVKILLHFCQISICLSFFQIDTMNISSNLYVLPKYFSDSFSVIIQLSTCFFNPTSGLNEDSIAFTQLLLIELLPILFAFVGWLVILGLYYYKVFNKQEFSYCSRNFFWFCFCGLFSLTIIRQLVAVTACSHIGQEKRMFADININCDGNTTRTVLLFAFVAPIFAALCAYFPLTLIQKIRSKNGQIVKKQPRKYVELNETKKQQSDNGNYRFSQGNNTSNNIANEDSTIQQSKRSDEYLEQGINAASSNYSKSNFSEEVSGASKPQDENQESDIIKMEYEVNELLQDEGRKKSDLKTTLIKKKLDGKLTNKTFLMMNYSYLTIGYKKEYEYWELVKFIFRQMVIVIMMFFNEIASFGGSICIVFYVGYLYFLNKFQPYTTGQLNDLEKEGTFIQAACLFAFVIIGQINGDYRFFFLADVLCFFAYLVFFWYLFKMFVLIFVSVCENHSKIDLVKDLFNKIIPKTYKINNFNSLKKWRLIQANLKVILQRGLDEKLLDRQFLIHQNKNLLSRKEKDKRDSEEEIINLDQQ